MKKQILVLILCFAVLSPAAKSRAERKDSVIGDALGNLSQKVKTGAAAVKQDVENYNTFIVHLDVRNTTDGAWRVEVRKEKGDETVFTARLAPGEHRRWRFETRAYFFERKHRVLFSNGRAIYTQDFDPSEQDVIEKTL